MAENENNRSLNPFGRKAAAAASAAMPAGILGSPLDVGPHDAGPQSPVGFAPPGTSPVNGLPPPIRPAGTLDASPHGVPRHGSAAPITSGFSKELKAQLSRMGDSAGAARGLFYRTDRNG